jgi:hypothetical protein
MDDKKNPFTKRDWNLTEQMVLTKEDPEKAKQLQAEAHFLDSERERMRRRRSLSEFNLLSAAEKVQFIRDGGEVTA